MSEKFLNSRIINKHDLEVNWDKAVNFIPKAGELIVYDIDSTYSYERFKIGDGSTVVSSLPFADANKVDKIDGKSLSTNDYTDADKSKLAGIAEGANKTTVDAALSSTSTNPVQNKVINDALAGKAASSHGTHVTYSTTAPIMDGTASAGSAVTVARSDHKHPTDTSRAAASDLTALQGLVGDKAVSTQITDAIATLGTMASKDVIISNSTTSLPPVTNGAILIAYDA